MTILAIDPGPEKSAFVLLGGDRIVHYGTMPNEQILDLLVNKTTEVEIVIEMIACYGMAVGKEVFETCVWIGRFMQVASTRAGDIADRDLFPHRITRHQVKMHLCHNVSAKDSNIRQALIDLFGPGKEKAIGNKKNPGPLYGIANDEWAALAVAMTWRDRSRSDLLEAVAV